MANQYVNKVEQADGTVLMDISSDTVAAGKMLSGITAHGKNGAPVTGNIPTKSSSDMTVSGKTVTAPAGYYASSQSKDVSDGEITNNTTLPSGKSSSGTINRGSYIKVGTGYHSEKYYQAQANSGTKAISSSGTISVDGYQNISIPAGSTTPNTPTINTTTGVVTATSDVTAGYQSAGQKSKTLQLNTKAAATYNVSGNDQEVSAGVYLTGKQTIRGVTTSGIDAANIKNGSVVKVGDADNAGRIKNVTGTFTASNTSTATKGAAAAGQILSGYSAWVNGSEVKGTFDMFALTVNQLKALTL